MKNYLLNLDKKFLPIVEKISREAKKQNVPVYLVGGIVRDIVLNKPSLDLDIVIESDAIQFARHLADYFNARCVAHKPFKTASVFLSNNLRLDFVTARSETYRFPGALPTVKPSSLREDLFRRDFTINAMAISLNRDSLGTFIDPFGGLKDLKNKKIRILHDKSFIDDPTRILRAVRFEQRLGFHIENKTLVLLKQSLSKKCFLSVNIFRSFMEFKKILIEVPICGLKRLNSLNAMGFFINTKRIRLGTIQRIDQYPLFKNKDFWLIYLMALVKEMSLEEKALLFNRFSFTKKEKQSLVDSLKVESVLKQLAKKDLTSAQVCVILKPFHADVVVYFLSMEQERNVKNKIEEFLEGCFYRNKE